MMRPAGTRRLLQLFYNDYVRLEMPPRHRFPMAKYFLVRSKLQAELAPGSFAGAAYYGAAVVPAVAAAALASFHPSPNATREELCAAHSTDYVDRVLRGQLSLDEVRRIGLPVHDAFLLRSTTAIGGTIAAMRAAMAAAPPSEFAVAGHVAGGTHHACVIVARGRSFSVCRA
jgi:acetoin utilization deacetylase AcuC-like enzyme